MNGDPVAWSATAVDSGVEAYPWPTIASCFMLAIVSTGVLILALETYLLILNILSIFLIPSQ